MLDKHSTTELNPYLCDYTYSRLLIGPFVRVVIGLAETGSSAMSCLNYKPTFACHT